MCGGATVTPPRSERFLGGADRPRWRQRGGGTYHSAVSPSASAMPRHTVASVVRALEEIAPPGSKYDFDRVGLQVGDAGAEVSRVMVALDLTPAVIEEAEAGGAELIITHHPLLFRPLDRLVPDNLVAAMAFRLARAGIAYYAIHTNLDLAPGGVSFALAELLGLEDVTFLDRQPGNLVKLATFVPADHAAAVREALAQAGAGRIGDYDACAFASRGTGFFRPGDAARPFIGEPGRMESAEEVKLEVEVTRWDLPAVLAALRAAHPYEEVAYDVVPMEQAHSRTGLGAVGSLPHPAPLADFLERVADKLGADALRYIGHEGREIRRVAVCGGSGSSLIGAAIRAGADAYVTADITYHTFFEPLDASGAPRLALIDAGHYETEWVSEQLIAARLADAFPDLAVQRARRPTNPVSTFTRHTEKH
jgi:dinuclear metal center YbgI/SA1388 family protein